MLKDKKLAPTKRRSKTKHVKNNDRNAKKARSSVENADTAESNFQLIQQFTCPTLRSIKMFKVIPVSTCLYVHLREDVYPRYAQIVSFDATTEMYTLHDNATETIFYDPLQHCNVVVPTDPYYAHCTKSSDLTWLRNALHNVLTELQALETKKPTNAAQRCQQQTLVFHRIVHASLLFENINSIPGNLMSVQPRQFNCALICSLHKVVSQHSLFDETLYLRGTTPRNYTTEKTLKKFCLATIAFRMATGKAKKINTKMRCISDLQSAHKQEHSLAARFLDFFSNEFNETYSHSFGDIRPGLEKYDLYKTTTNLLKKKNVPLYSKDTPKGGAMHYKHFLLYDNLSSVFRKAFISGLPLAKSPTEMFPLLTPDQSRYLLQNANQLWAVFVTEW